MILEQCGEFGVSFEVFQTGAFRLHFSKEVNIFVALSLSRIKTVFSLSLVSKDGRNASVLVIFEQRSGFVVSIELCKTCVLFDSVYALISIEQEQSCPSLATKNSVRNASVLWILLQVCNVR